MHKNHFCLIWKSNGIISNQAIKEELKPNVKVVDIVISDKDVKSFVEFEYNRKKVQFQLTNMIVYDLELFNTD